MRYRVECDMIGQVTRVMRSEMVIACASVLPSVGDVRSGLAVAASMVGVVSTNGCRTPRAHALRIGGLLVEEATPLRIQVGYTGMGHLLLSRRILRNGLE